MNGPPRLLFVTPVLPATTGNGLAMRAGLVLRALARRYAITLAVLPIYAAPTESLEPELAAACERVLELPAGASLPPPDSRRGRAGLRTVGRLLEPLLARQRFWLDGPFEVLHLFRLAVIPFVREWLSPTRAVGLVQLDLDDLELESRARIAALYRANGQEQAARRETLAAEQAAQQERRALQRIDRVYVCSERDRAALQARSARAEVRVLPNGLTPRPDPGQSDPEAPPTLLFVGTLGYYPNEDAALYFCREVLPRLRRLMGRPIRVLLVGPGPGPAVADLTSNPDVIVTGAVDDLSDYYRQAHCAIAPLRAGGGTRIKVLEAFANRRPVVSTTIGSEGIAVRDGEHLLLADTPELFAEACARLLADPAQRAALATRALDLFEAHYSLDAVAARL